jgi:hypothetical protein
MAKRRSRSRARQARPVEAPALDSAAPAPAVRVSEVVRRVSPDEAQDAELEALEAGWDELLA